jgi:MFS family permease
MITINKILNDKSFFLKTIVFIRIIAINLIGVFLPIYFIKEISILAFAYYFMGYFIGTFFSIYIFLYLMRLYLLPIIFFLSVLSLLISALLLDLKNETAVLFSAIFLSFSERFFWLPFHVIYLFLERKKEKEYAIINAIIHLAPFLCPLIGLFIITNFGYNSLFLFTFFFYSLVAIFFILSKDLVNEIKEMIKKQGIQFYFKQKLSLKPIYLADVLRTNVLGILWPGILVLMNWKIDEISYLFSLLSLSAGIFSIIYSHYLVKNPYKLSSYAFLIHSFSIILRTLPMNVFQITGGLLGYISFSFFDPHYMGYFYNRIKKDFSELIKREMNFVYGYLFIFFFSLIFYFYPYSTFVFLAVLTSLSSIYSFYFFIKRKKVYD